MDDNSLIILLEHFIECSSSPINPKFSFLNYNDSFLVGFFFASTKISEISHKIIVENAIVFSKVQYAERSVHLQFIKTIGWQLELYFCDKLSLEKLYLEKQSLANDTGFVANSQAHEFKSLTKSLNPANFRKTLVEEENKKVTSISFNENGEKVVKTIYYFDNSQIPPLSWKEKAAVGSFFWVLGLSVFYYNKYLHGMDEEAIRRYLQDPNNRPSDAWGCAVTLGIIAICIIAKYSDK